MYLNVIRYCVVNLSVSYSCCGNVAACDLKGHNMTNQLPKLAKAELNTIRLSLSTAASQNNNDGYYRLALDAVSLYNKLFPRESYPKHVTDSLAKRIAEG